MPRSFLVIVGAAVPIGLLALGWAMAQPDGKDLGTPAWRHTDLHARYAEARLRLAEMRLQKAESLNALRPGEVTEADLRSLRSTVDLLRSDVEQTRQRPHGSGFVAQRQAARAAVRLAEQELQAAIAVNRRHADAMPPLDLRIREQQLEIARLRAEIWDDPAFLVSSTDVLQMQIDQLVDQMQDILHDVQASPTIQRR